MDDWHARRARGTRGAGPDRLLRAGAATPEAIDELAALLEDAQSPALVVGAGADTPRAGRALVALAEHLSCPVWNEAFGARAGFPQDHPLFAGHLSPEPRPAARRCSAGTTRSSPSARRSSASTPTSPARWSTPARGCARHRRPGRGAPQPFGADRAGRAERGLPGPGDTSAARRGPSRGRSAPPPAPPRRPRPASRCAPGHVLAALAERLPADAVLVEESPSSRPELHARVPARAPLGFVSAAMGGLGFALPGTIGLRMALPDRPVLAVLGDGSSLYAIQALWSAARYGVGALFIVLANGGYAIMDKLAEPHRQAGAVAGSTTIDIAAIAGALGCEAARVEDHADARRTLDESFPALAGRDAPLLLEVAVAP